MTAPSSEQLLEAAARLKNVLVSFATGGGGEDEEYKRLRKQLLDSPSTSETLPRFVRTSRDLGDFWQFIKREFSTYAERRTFLREQFEPILILLESQSASPSDQLVATALTSISSVHAHHAWRAALERRITDPEGAITASRTLLESVCKHILDEDKITYDDKADLPRLYGLAADQLALAPSQHTEQLFKRILGGCHTVVDGLAAIRNQLGDAHGKSGSRMRPSPRHAELAVNLAGAVATFLVATWEARSKSG